MSGNYVNSEDRDTLLEIKLPKPPNKYQPNLLVVVLLSIGFAILTFFTDESVLFAAAMSLVIFGLYRYVNAYIVLDRLTQYHGAIKTVQEILTTPVENDEGHTKVYKFIQPNPEILQKLQQLHLYAKSLRSSKK